MAHPLKPKKKGLFNTVFGFVLAFFGFGAAATAGTFAGINGKLGHSFQSSYNLRYEYDPYKISEDPTAPVLPRDYYNDKDHYNKLKANLKEMAQSYSAFLLDRGISNGNVYPEITKDDTGLVHIYLNSTVDITKVTSKKPVKDDKDKEVDIAPSLAYFDSMFSNRFTLLYNDGYTTHEDTKSSSNDDTKGINHFRESKFYTWSINDFGDDSLVDSNDRISANYNTNTINIHLKNGLSFGAWKDTDKKEYKANSVKQNFYKAKNPDKSETDPKYPFIWIIRDFEGMLNKLQYLYYVQGFKYQPKLTPPSGIDKDKVADTLYQIPDGSSEMNYFTSTGKYESDGTDIPKTFFTNDQIKDQFTSIKFTDGNGFQTESNSKLNKATGFKLTAQDIANYKNPLTAQGQLLNSYLLAFVQGWDTYGNKKEIETDTHLPTPGQNETVKYDFLKPYVLGVVTKTNFTDYLPDKNPTKNTVDSDGEWLSIKNDGHYFTTQELYRELTSEKFAYPLMNVLNPTHRNVKNNLAFYTTTGLGKNNNVNVDVIDNYIDGSVAVNQSVVTSLVALAIIALFIGIIISVLYRVPGLVVFLMQILPVTLAFLLLFTFGYHLSITMILASIVGLLASTISGVNILNKIKKNYLQHKTLDQSVFAAYTKSFFSCLDNFGIMFLLGACLLFFPSGQLFNFGISLILLSGLSLLSVYLGSWLINAFIFNNAYGMFKYRYLTGIKTDNNLVAVDQRYSNSYRTQAQGLIDHGFDKDGYISRVNFKHPTLFNKWTSLAVISLLITLIVTGFSLLLSLGPITSFTFYGGTRLMVYAGNGINLDKIFDVLSSLGINRNDWHNIILNSTDKGYIYLETSLTLTVDQINTIKTQLGALVQSIDPTVALQTSYHAIYALMTFIGLMLVYTLLRYRWFYLIPVLVTNVLVIGASIGLFFLTFISFNTYIAFGGLIVALMVNWMMFGFINSINDKWGNNFQTTYSELILKIKYTYMNYFENYLVILASWAVVIVIGGLFMPLNMSCIFIMMIFSMLLIIISMNTWFCSSIYYFINFKNIQKNRIKQINSNLSIRNLDKIDEELINTINTNTKVITE